MRPLGAGDVVTCKQWLGRTSRIVEIVHGSDFERMAFTETEGDFVPTSLLCLASVLRGKL